MKQSTFFAAIVCCTVCVLFTASDSLAFLKTQYVDPDYSGMLTRDGSSAAPWETIQDAFDDGFFTGGGDRNVIKIGDGVYEEVLSLTTGANVEFYGDYDGWPNWNRGTGTGYTVTIQHPSSGSPTALFTINISSGSYDAYFERITFKRANSKYSEGIHIGGAGVDQVKFTQCNIENFTDEGIYMEDEGYSSTWDLYLYNITIKDCGGCGVYLPDADNMNVWFGGFVFQFNYYPTLFTGNNLNNASGSSWSDGQICIQTQTSSCGGSPNMLLDGDIIKWENCTSGQYCVEDYAYNNASCVNDSLTNKTICCP